MSDIRRSYGSREDDPDFEPDADDFEPPGDDFEPDENEIRAMAANSAANALVEARRVLGDNVRALRQARGWSQGDVIERLRAHGIAYGQTTVTKLENGQRPTPAEEVWALAQVFDVDYDRLLRPVPPPDDAERRARWALARARARLSALRTQRAGLVRRLDELDVSILRATSDVRDLEARITDQGQDEGMS